MAATIKVNGTVHSLVHKFSNGITIATIPDVCKTPSPGGPVPIPYPNIAQSITLADGTTTVKGDKTMAAVKGSKFALSNGDNPGVAGGVKSSTFMKEATWILYSFTVKMNKKNAARFMDKMFHNHENAANLSGAINPPVTIEVFEQILKDCIEAAAASVNKKHLGSPSGPKTKAAWQRFCKSVVGKDARGKDITGAMQRGTDIGEEAEACVNEKMQAQGRGNEVSTEQSYNGTAKGPQAVGNRGDVIKGSQRPDVVLHEAGNPNAVRGVYDFKAPCPPSNMPHWGDRGAFDQGELYMHVFRQVPKIVAPGYRIAPFATPVMKGVARLLGLPI